MEQDTSAAAAAAPAAAAAQPEQIISLRTTLTRNHAETKAKLEELSTENKAMSIARPDLVNDAPGKLQTPRLGWVYRGSVQPTAPRRDVCIARPGRQAVRPVAHEHRHAPAGRCQQGQARQGHGSYILPLRANVGKLARWRSREGLQDRKPSVRPPS
jgi:hypothetical protein